VPLIGGAQESRMLASSSAASDESLKCGGNCRLIRGEPQEQTKFLSSTGSRRLYRFALMSIVSLLRIADEDDVPAPPLFSAEAAVSTPRFIPTMIDVIAG